MICEREDWRRQKEDLKDELTTIVMTQTSHGVGGRDKWDTPEIKLPNGKKGKLRKDRYSALVIANMIARQMNRELAHATFDMIGANLRTMEQKDGQLYKGPNWLQNQLTKAFSKEYTDNRCMRDCSRPILLQYYR